MTYEDFVLRTMRNQRTARSMDEAFRTPTYACAVTRFEPAHKRDLRNLVVIAITVIAIVSSMYVITTMFDLLIESIR